MKKLNITMIILSVSFVMFYFFSGGCAKGPIEVTTPTPTTTATPTSGPTAVPEDVYQIEISLNGTPDQDRGFYIFAFNRPNPITEDEADPISTSSDYWTDYISYGPLTNQEADFIRRERLLAGDITSDWNSTQFAFTTGIVSDSAITIILPLETLGNPEDLYFNFITTDINGNPRDALGFSLGSSVDSIRVKDMEQGETITFDDSVNDVYQTETLPDNVDPETLDIVSGVIVFTEQ